MNTGILCPRCNGPTHRVEKTETWWNFIRRTRRCADCEARFTTYEGASAAHGRFVQTFHLQAALTSMRAERRRLVENLIEILAPKGARVEPAGEDDEPS